MKTIPTFETQRLILRGVLESDAEEYARHFINYEVIRHLAAGVPWPYPDDGIMTYIKDQILPFQGDSKWVWAITFKESPDTLIGVVELLSGEYPFNRGFWLGEQFWGKGIMMEAVEPVTDFAFQTLGFKVLTFANAAGNIRSARIKEKSGARFVRRESAKFVDPNLLERDVFELTPQDWLGRKTKN